MIVYPSSVNPQIDSTTKYRQQLVKRQWHSIKWLILLSQLCGSAPVNRQFSAVISEDSSKFSSLKSSLHLLQWAHSIWSLLIMCLIFYGMISYRVDFFDGSLLGMIDPVGFIFNIAQCLFIMIGCNYQSAWFSIYFQNFIEIDVRLHQLGGQQFHCTLRRFLLYCICPVIAVIVINIVMELLFLPVSYFVVLRNLVVFLLPELIISQSVCQYLALQHALKQRFAQINFILKKLMSERLGAAGGGVKNRRQKRENEFLIVKPTKKESLLLDEQPLDDILRSLRLLCNKICRISDQINGSFGLLLITLSMATFVFACLQLYMLYTLIFFDTSDGNGSNPSRAFKATMCTMWLIFVCGRLYVILCVIESVENEKSNIAPILYQMDFFGKINMADIELCINKFALQILHEKRHQTACGILELDLTLVTTIVGALTTYLVILIQFDSSARSLVNLTATAPAPTT